MAELSDLKNYLLVGEFPGLATINPYRINREHDLAFQDQVATSASGADHEIAHLSLATAVNLLNYPGDIMVGSPVVFESTAFTIPASNVIVPMCNRDNLHKSGVMITQYHSDRLLSDLPTILKYQDYAEASFSGGKGADLVRLIVVRADQSLNLPDRDPLQKQFDRQSSQALFIQLGRVGRLAIQAVTTPPANLGVVNNSTEGYINATHVAIGRMSHPRVDYRK